MKKKEESKPFPWYDIMVIVGIVLVVIGVVGVIVPAFVDALEEINEARPPVATLAREGTVEDIEFFQHGALNESRTFVNFYDARSIILGGYHPLEENTRYLIRYREYPCQTDREVPDDAHVTLWEYTVVEE